MSEDTGQQAQPEPEDSDAAWRRAWDAQYDLWQEIDDALSDAGRGHSDAFMAALTAYLIEHLAERQRMYLKLPTSDERPEPES